MLSNVTRDAQVHAVTAEVAALRSGHMIGATREVLSAGRRSKRALALLDLALAFSTWRALAVDSGLGRRAAVDTMVAAVRCAASS